MDAVMDEREALRTSFERFAAAHAASDPAWLRTRRASALARYVEAGPPRPSQEAWRHTPVAPLVRTRFVPADVSRRPDPLALARVPADGLTGASIVFVNGRFVSELSRLRPGHGVEISSLRELLRDDPARGEPWLGRVLGERGGALCDLNTAFAEDGAVVRIAPGAVVAEPIHVVHVAAPKDAPSLSYLRTLVVAGRGSESRLVETFVGPDGHGYLVNSVTEILVAEDARVDHYKLQREGEQGLHVAALAVELGRGSRLLDHAISLGGALSRNDIDVVFRGEGGECSLDGLFVVDGERVSDTHSRIDHATPHCTSRQLYKGILDARARGVFNGLVVVRPGAQKTDAVQTNKNLLLSREALVHSTPQLEIRANDVKCKHGSTTGQLDATALFYLRSRGIGEAAARSLLTWAFASDVLQGVKVAAVRQAAERQLQARLPGVAELAELPS
jgi:Fe-S cluster assembly protein SufD